MEQMPEIMKWLGITMEIVMQKKKVYVAQFTQKKFKFQMSVTTDFDRTRFI
jgi:hypothetical protein